MKRIIMLVAVLLLLAMPHQVSAESGVQPETNSQLQIFRPDLVNEVPTAGGPTLELPNGAFITKEGDNIVAYRSIEKKEKLLSMPQREDLESETPTSDSTSGIPPALVPPGFSVWMAHARKAVVDLSYLGGTWQVPDPPEALVDGSVIFYFNAITQDPPVTILHSVLEYNQTGHPNKWTMCSWYYDPSTDYRITGEHIEVNSGDYIGGYMQWVAPYDGFWICRTIKPWTDEVSEILVDDLLMPPGFLRAYGMVLETNGAQVTDYTGLPSSCTFNDIHANYLYIDPLPCDFQWQLNQFGQEVIDGNIDITSDPNGLSWVKIEVSAPPPDPPPVAAFTTVGPREGVMPYTVQFQDLSTGPPESWNWDFGDGGTSTAQNPTHTYETDGVYDVTLECTNELGSDTLVKPGYITVDCCAPGEVLSRFDISATEGPAPLTVQVTDRSCGDIISRQWMIGGQCPIEPDENGYITFNCPGTYDLELWDRGNCNCGFLDFPCYIYGCLNIDIQSVIITVEEPAAAPGSSGVMATSGCCGCGSDPPIDPDPVSPIPEIPSSIQLALSLLLLGGFCLWRKVLIRK